MASQLFTLAIQIEKIIPDFKKENPDFSNAYDAARIIKDVAAHHKGKGNNGSGSTPKPPESK